ncbi:hypothetical protein [Ruminiclostridium cellobioparum]|jgi:uncharacterized protein involved in tolerance to divalent cations|uniref:hypothetical protein n=1 Tax=Ruminiclostridium cellobioparum TaxID=29355 RepID=UPI000489444A|nr:hypothetical protein [Ruminiclostridium cellobioparum]
MDDRKEMIRKKSILLNMKKQIEEIKAVSIIDFLEAESEEVTKYSESVSELHKYSYPRLCTRKMDGDNDNLVDWFLENLSFIKDGASWLMPFKGMGIWWVKVKVDDCKKALSELWRFGDICIVDVENKVIFYIGVNEANCEIALKQL